ncbi:MAG: lipoprotein signal peptidase [Candidatus Paraprevotella stercoravium]|uniref:Lipoprotein signal peptidase n=2 Tax=Bacteroidales TaxID=171549 RepID=A0ABT7U8G1_9BACE|nr:lipoprotein signal peptidase [Candidatus Paraprevotella stercoravium]MDM8146834.1 lipoprotein signal peptidase [Bacteroides eggerthii]
MKKTSYGRYALLIITAVLVIDQCIKFWVKTNMYMYERIRIADWFYILFTENPGMAFGWEFMDKIFLTLFRIVAVALISIYMYRIIRKRKAPFGFIVCLSLILAGAAGNIIDCLFYGLIFNNPPAPFVAHIVPFGTGYAPLFYGKVVDMFYFPIIRTTWPDWMPIWGGESFVFFSPVFNFADAAISCGIIALLLFYHKRINL